LPRGRGRLLVWSPLDGDERLNARRTTRLLALSFLASALLVVLLRTSSASTAPSRPAPGSAIQHFSDLSTPWGGVTLNRYRPHVGPDNEQTTWQPADATSPPFQPWASGGGIWEVGTRYGPGFKVVCTAEMVAPWPSHEHQTKAVFLADADHLVQGVGYTENWSGKLMFPSRGNPGGFPKRWHAGVLVEFHTQTASGMHLAIDGRGPVPRFRFGIYDPTTDDYRFVYAPNRIRFGHWYSWRMTIRWSNGRDGYFRGWLNGRLLATYDGPTLKQDDDHPKLQFGYYSIAELRNEVWYAAIRRT
jgi:Polysaccharide lyase